MAEIAMAWIDQGLSHISQVYKLFTFHNQLQLQQVIELNLLMNKIELLI